MDIRQALQSAVGTSGSGDSADLSLDVLIALMLLRMDDRIEGALNHIVQLENIIMADETKIDADVQSVSADLDEIQTGVTALQAALAAGNTAAAQAEVDKIVAKLDPLAAKARTAAGQFDAPAPAPVTPPAA